MTIHDDALTAFHAVYDTALAEKDAAVTAAEAVCAGLRSVNLDLQEQNDALRDEIAALLARIAEFEAPTVEPSAYLPLSFSSVEEARVALGAPDDANYVVWDHGDQHLEQVFRTLGANDILVLPERDNPYLVDASKGFMAGGVKEIDGPSGRIPVTSNSRLWFAMARAQRGILGLGPGARIAPSESSWTAPAQPKTMLAYLLNGTTQSLVGTQNKVIEAQHAKPFFGNFTITGRDLGGVAYNTIGTSNRATTITRIHFDGSWRGFSAVPNGEAGAINLAGGTYDISHCTFRSDGGPSPIMWNRTNGGTLRHIVSDAPNHGMITFWRSGGLNVFEDVTVHNTKLGINLEETLAGFNLDWRSGGILLTDSDTGFHLNSNPSGGSQKIHVGDVEIAGGYKGHLGELAVHVYTTKGTQRRADVTFDGGQVAHLPADAWV